jgi:hypothetical protein
VNFKDNRDLHFAIAHREMEVLRTRFEEASSRARTGLTKVEAIGRAYMAYGLEFPHYFDACARLELQQASQEVEPSPQECTCIEAGQRVHTVVVDALHIGIADGTIRPDVGDPTVVSRILWGFTHGLIQIAITKSKPLAESGISVPQLTQQAIALVLYMLRPPGSAAE